MHILCQNAWHINRMSYRSDHYGKENSMTDPSYKETMEFVDSLFINWNKLVAKKHGVTSTASRLFELGDFMHDVMKETLTQKMEADNE